MKVTINHPAKVTLTLKMSEQEASIIMGACRCIAGSSTGPRGLFDQINSALEKKGIKPLEGIKGSIRFPNDWPSE